MVVHVVDPGRPGGGMYSERHPDYLVLNTPCGQHSLYPYPAAPGEERLGLGFYEWAVAEGYYWDGLECRKGQPGPGSVPLTPYDFLPRRLMGEYLEWFYGVLCSEAPGNVRVIHHATRAVDIEPLSDGHECVHLEDGSTILVDHVVLTTGHVKASGQTAKPAKQGVGARGAAWVTDPYPIEGYLPHTGPHEKVAVEGMGLVALDVVTALTIGLGGRYEEEGDGRLRYLPSGREPSLYLFSRSGYPYCGKSFGASDPMGDYRPAICTVEAVARLKGAPGPARQMDARAELLPLVFAEMELCYYMRAAEVAEGRAAAQTVREVLLAAWESGTFQHERAQLAKRYGDFQAHEYFFVGEGLLFRDSADYEAQVCATVDADAREALVQGGKSPVKTALETLRALRDTLRMAVEFKGLTFESHLDFVAHMRSRFARLVAGPPVFRSQQLLALVEAGVVKMPFGPRPEVIPTDDGKVLVRSLHLQHPYELTVDRLIRAHLDLPSVTKSTSPLLNRLAARGRLRPLNFDGLPGGSVDLTEDFHPVNVDGEAEHTLWIFGVLSEGARYFTLYIPSPKSRVRAFLDAEAAAKEMFAGTGTIVLDQPAAAPAYLPARPSSGFVARATGALAAPLRLALVNNMPDGAFEETEQQFRDLLENVPGHSVEVSCYTLPGVQRIPRIAKLISDDYGDFNELWASRPDALVITGAEPKKAELTEESYWPSLEKLLWWGRTTVPSILASCLTAHAALWAFDRLPRKLLLEKCMGVFVQSIDPQHPLMQGVAPVALPHSRFNEVPAKDLLRAGYRVLAQCGDAGWTVAVGERDRCQLLLLQGHPEYSQLALLREYRRDVRRYLAGEQGSYPHLPKGYLDREALDALGSFELKLSGLARDPALMEEFPFDFAASHVNVDWASPARTLIANWLRTARERAGLVAGVAVGAGGTVGRSAGSAQFTSSGGVPGTLAVQ